jgi:hypothetical protein
MKLIVGFCFCSCCLLCSVRADLTLTQKVEGAGQNTAMSVKIKGSKVRVEASPQTTMIIDTSTGEMTNLMHEQKTVVRISGEKMKAAMETMRKFKGESETPKVKLTPTGKKENINGYDAEEYSLETPTLKARFWLVPKYPDGAAILKQLQVLNSEHLQQGDAKMPDYADFPGVPVKTVISVGGTEITTTLVSLKQDPVNDAEFEVPKDYHEAPIMKANTETAKPAGSPSSESPNQ